MIIPSFVNIMKGCLYSLQKILKKNEANIAKITGAIKKVKY